jgi:hypothetical protein
MDQLPPLHTPLDSDIVIIWTQILYIPEITFRFEISVPPQKYFPFGVSKTAVLKNGGLTNSTSLIIEKKSDPRLV